jgi:sulfatase maturation enzyme AslB (radical SAM superfamily)
MSATLEASVARYPCSCPFDQLYLVPRKALDLRFCSYHAPQYIELTELLEGGVAALDKAFETHPALAEARARFLAGEYLQAGCSPGCHPLCAFQTTDRGVAAPVRESAAATPALKRLWISIGPDCNLRCRYCLDPEHFEIDYNTCDPRVLSILPAFVERGGEVLVTGGEPFLPKFKFADILRQLRGCDSGGLIRIQTNGTYLDEKTRRLILEAPVATVNISFDTVRPELFEYLRHGARFQTVWNNMLALKAERDALGLNRPFLVVLCAVLRANYDHLFETVEAVAAQGIPISLNALFKGYYSPDFCREQGLHSLSIKELESLAATIGRIRDRFGANGLVGWAGLDGQVQNLLREKREGHGDFQVSLGDGGEAPRKQRKPLKRFWNSWRTFFRRPT